MRNYDFPTIKNFIDQHRDEIDTVLLGMHEDWYWTADTVFENGEYQKDLADKDTKIGGIIGSYWATPVMQVHFKNGHDEIFNSWIGDQEETAPMFPLSGCITDQVNSARSRLEIKNLDGAK